MLDSLKIRVIEKGGFVQHMKSIGKLGGQNKVPRLSNDRSVANNLLNYEKKVNIGILGSTGSIGTQALQVISECKSIDYSVDFLTANNNFKLLIQQAIKHRPKSVVIANEAHVEEIKKQLKGLNISIYSGTSSLEKVVETETTNIVLTALVGFSGLKPTINAIKCGKKIALANKETLVVAGELIMSLCKKKASNYTC